MNNLASQNLAEFISNEGTCSTSMLTLYPGYQYFEINIRGFRGAIAYVDTQSVWVGAGDPVLSHPGILEEFISEFFEEAKKNRKVAYILPASKAISDLARKRDLLSFQIGSEPWFKLGGIHPNLAQARQLLKKGATVKAFDPEKLEAREHIEIEEITRGWLKSRKMPALGFLNRLEPWIGLEFKRYFHVIYNGLQVGYLAAVPIKSKRAWYLVDLIRAPNAPVGTTELLVVEAMRQLELEGAKEVSLGMSPFVRFSNTEDSVYPYLYKVMDFSLNRMGFIYNFKLLFEYKKKFGPSNWEPLYFVCSEKRVNPLGLFRLMRVVMPHGFMSILRAVVANSFSQIDSQVLAKRFLTHKILLRSMPSSFLEFVMRSKATLTLAVVNVLFYSVTSGDDGHLRAKLASKHAYQWTRLIEHGFSLESIKLLVIPSVLHWDLSHLFTNLIFLSVFVGLLELLAGTEVVGIAFLSGVILSNPLTSALIIPIVGLFSNETLIHFKQSQDVGSSLGIFSCMGVLAYFFRHTKAALSILVLGVLAVAYLQQDLLALNHLIAIAIGFMFIQYFLPKDAS